VPTIRKQSFIVLALIFYFVNHSAHSDIHAYPSKGQTHEQQNKDKWQCHQWATEQTGIDPISMAEKEIKPPESPSDSVASGAKKGLFHGLIAGEIRGGNFAQSVPMGTGIGALMTLRRHRKEMEKQHQEYVQAHNERAAKLKTYDKTYGVCMKGRGYTVN